MSFPEIFFRTSCCKIWKVFSQTSSYFKKQQGENGMEKTHVEWPRLDAFFHPFAGSSLTRTRPSRQVHENGLARELPLFEKMHKVLSFPLYPGPRTSSHTALRSAAAHLGVPRCSVSCPGAVATLHATLDALCQG